MRAKICLPSKNTQAILFYTGLQTENVEPVDCVSILGAVGGPCSGHLSVSQLTLVEVFVVLQMNSSAWLNWQTWVADPECIRAFILSIHQHKKSNLFGFYFVQLAFFGVLMLEIRTNFGNYESRKILKHITILRHLTHSMGKCMSGQCYQQRDKSGQVAPTLNRQGRAGPWGLQNLTSLLKVLVLLPKNLLPLPTTQMCPQLRFHYVHQALGVGDALFQLE